MKQKLLNSFRLKATLLVAVLCVLFTGQAWADDVTDELTASDLAATSTTYTNFSNVSKTSDAVYAGNSAKDGSGNIQLRSKNSTSGIVSTTSGGKVKSITITVGSGSNTVDVYGSNSAYSGASDLYGNNKGTKLGSVSSTGTINVSGDYEYVGIRSNNGALYLSKIEIVWTTSGGGGSSLTDSDLALTGAPIAFNFDLYNNSTAQVINYTTSSTGAVTIADNEYAEFDIDEENKTITVTPTAVTPSAQTITISQEADATYAAGSATFTVSVANSDPTIPGTSGNPYSVAQAIAATPASGTSANVYIRGIVSQFYNTSIVGDGTNYRYYISDNGTTTEQLLVYKGKNVSNVAFSETTDLQLGDVVTIYGGLTTFSNAPEVAQNNYLASKTRPTVTVTSNNDSYGTVALSTRTVTAAPADGYRFASPKYTVTTGSATVTDNGDNTFTLSNIWDDCAIQFNFEAIPQLDPNTILYVGDSYDLNIASVGGQINLWASASHGSVQSEIVTAGTTVDASKYTWDGYTLNVSAGGNGTIVIRFWVDEGETYQAAEQITTVTVKADPVIGYAGETHNVYYSSSATIGINTDRISGGAITLSSDNENVATVSGLNITSVAVGTTTITINTAAAEFWNAGSATFTLNVVQPEGKTTAYNAASGTLFAESFGDNSSSARAWDDDYSGKSGVSAVYSGASYIVTDAKQSKNTMGQGEAGSALVAGSGKEGFFVVGPLNVASYSSLAVSNYFGMSSGTWNENSYMKLYYSTNGTDYTEVSRTDSNTPTGAVSNHNNYQEATYSLPVAAQSSTLYLKFAFYCYQVNKNSEQIGQAYFDGVSVSGTAPALTATLNGNGYATYCSEYPLDFSGATDYSAWQITGISGETITFEKITGTVKGGTGLFLMGTPSATVTLTSDDSSTTLSENLLKGTIAPEYVAAGAAYGLSGNQFVQSRYAGTIKAGKAYIDADDVPELSSVKAFTFVFEDPATGITETRTATREEVEGIFNLAGQRMSKMQKGINIVNGKKVLVK